MSIQGNHVQNATHSGECMCKWGIKRSFYERTFFHWQRHQSVREPMMSIVPEEESMHSHNLSPDEDTKPDSSKAFPSSKSRTFQTLSAVQAFGAIMASDLKVNQKSSGSQTQLTGLMSVSSTSQTLPPSYQFQGSSGVVQQVSILPTCLLETLLLEFTTHFFCTECTTSVVPNLFLLTCPLNIKIKTRIHSKFFLR